MLETTATSPGPQTSSPPKSAVLLVNSRSRRGEEWFASAKSELRNHGFDLPVAQSFRKIDRMLVAARAAVKDETPLIIAGGGDGTFNALSNILAGTNTGLGVLPLGTGNALARDLGIQPDVAAACRVVADGKWANVDLGMVDSKHFVNVATVGFTTRIARSLTEDMKRKYGRFVYVVAIIAALRKMVPFRAILETENGRREIDTLQVVIGNGRYHAGPFPVSPDASIVDGKLSIYALEAVTRGALLRMALRMPTGHHVDLADVHAENASGGTLTTVPDLAVTTDGEIGKPTPIKFRSLPGALKVVVPGDFESSPI